MASRRVKFRLEVIASFYYLVDMVSAGWGCELAVTSHVKTAWKKFKELLPVLTSCHQLTRPVLWPCAQLLCVKRHAPCQQNLAIDQDESGELAMKWQGHDQTDLQYQGRGCVHRKGMPATGKAWAWGPWPHFKKKKTLLVWTCGGLVWTCGVFLWCSKNSMWCRWGPGGGPSWNGRNWLKMTAVSWSSRQMTLKKEAPGDQVWDLLCVQLASYLEGGPLMWMMPLHPRVNKKSNYDMGLDVRKPVFRS